MFDLVMYLIVGVVALFALAIAFRLFLFVLVGATLISWIGIFTGVSNGTTWWIAIGGTLLSILLSVLASPTRVEYY